MNILIKLIVNSNESIDIKQVNDIINFPFRYDHLEKMKINIMQLTDQLTKSLSTPKQ